MLHRSLEGASAREIKDVESELRKLGRTIQSQRQKSKLSQEALAEELDISVNTVKYIEQGRRFPSLPMLIRICRRIGLDFSIKPKS